MPDDPTKDKKYNEPIVDSVRIQKDEVCVCVCLCLARLEDDLPEINSSRTDTLIRPLQPLQRPPYENE